METPLQMWKLVGLPSLNLLVSSLGTLPRHHIWTIVRLSGATWVQEWPVMLKVRPNLGIASKTMRSEPCRLEFQPLASQFCKLAL